MNQAISTGRPAAVQAPGASLHERPPYALALLSGALVFALYAITLAPTTAFWDTSEYIATAHILGVPHPPGNPVFVLMARAWELILAPTGLSVAVRVNLFSSLMGAATAGLWFLVVHRILSAFTVQETVRRVGAGIAVLVSATAFTVWNQSNVNEKVYSIALFTIALLSWIAFLWREHVEEHRATRVGRFHDDNALVFMAYVLALSVGNHLMAFLAAPALVLFFFLVKPQVFLNWKLYAASAVVAVVGLSVHLYLPIRSGLQPIINEAAPTCESLGSAVVSVLTFGSAGCENLSAALAREQYAKPPVSERLAPIGDQLLNYFQYFDWQWARSLTGSVGYFAPARMPVTLLFLGLGLYGAWRHWERDRKSFAYIATLFFTLSFGLVFYLNFKYGFGQVQALGLSLDLGEVRERDYFFLVSFSMWGLWVGVGLTALWLELSQRLGGGRAALARGAPVLLLAFLPLVLNWPYASRRGDYAARDWAYNLLMSVEPYGVLFTNGDNDTFPLWYVQEVEGIRKDVTVIVWSYLNTPWYAQQIRQLTTPCERPGQAEQEPTRIVCQRQYVAPEGVTLYPDAPRPTRTILPLSDEEIDSATMYGYVQLPDSVVFEARGIRTGFPAGAVLPAADQFILAIIKQAWGDRPIYFAATTNAHRKLGLDQYTVRQGVAFRLSTDSERQRQGVVPLPPTDPYTAVLGNFVDVPRTQALLWDVFEYRNLPERSHWSDDATRGIPTYFGYAHYALAQAHQALGSTENVQQNMERVEQFMGLAER